jgi:DNA-binding XRE family transcriptional regulator
VSAATCLATEVVTLAQVAQVRKELVQQLAAWRKVAGLTQVQLARRVVYSRSSVANTEIGRHTMPRAFWHNADRKLGAEGALVAGSTRWTCRPTVTSACGEISRPAEQKSAHKPSRPQTLRVGGRAHRATVLCR